jgi:hypothetical protein
LEPFSLVVVVSVVVYTPGFMEAMEEAVEILVVEILVVEILVVGILVVDILALGVAVTTFLVASTLKH